MKKILLLGLLLLTACESSVVSTNISGKGKLLKRYEDYSYYIDYDNFYYVVIMEIDNNTHEIKKEDKVEFSNVYYIPRNDDRSADRYRYTDYLIYENTREFIIYTN